MLKMNSVNMLTKHKITNMKVTIFMGNHMASEDKNSKNMSMRAIFSME